MIDDLVLDEFDQFEPKRAARRIKLTVAYDGTDFFGWAAQKGRRTVHSTLTEAVRQVCGEEVDIIGASRTDSGAHAKGQVCHFDTNVDMDPQKWAYVLNRVLPQDVSVWASAEAEPIFHSRFCAEDRFYRYRIRTTLRDPFEGRFAHEYGRPLDVAAMEEAAKHLVGTHDFKAYTEELEPTVQNTVRTLRSVLVLQIENPAFGNTGAEVYIDVVGTAFLRGMMRRMSGALLEVGRRQRAPEDVKRLLTDERDSMQWPVVLPAKGLCLMHVRYGKPLRDNRTAENNLA